MPHKDPEVRRAYARERARKRRSDPEFRAKETARYMERLRERLKDPAFREARNAKHRAEHAANRRHQLDVQRKRYERFKKSFEEWRSKLQCERCGSKNDLQFHHKDRKTKVQNVASLFHAPRLFKIEVEKCEVLCKPCHKDHHRSERRHKALV